MSDTWKEFWSTYRFEGKISEDLLFEQVGRTVNGRPVPRAELDLSVRFMRESLALAAEDVLFEYCCGNGLISYELASEVRQVIAVDFSEHLIQAARQFRQRPNIAYMVGDALQPLGGWLQQEAPRKFLMANALAYFDPADLDRILRQMLVAAPPGEVRFLLTAIPDAERKWNFYDTPERRRRHEAHLAQGGGTNDGMGRWWTEDEIREVARRHGLAASIVPEPGSASHYRMAALLT
jgi:SAM-dependent methyltransferase